MGGAKNAIQHQLSPVTSMKYGISLEYFLTFIFNPFATRLQCFKAIPSTSPKLLSFNQDQASQKSFLAKSFKIEFMIFFVTEMLQ